MTIANGTHSLGALTVVPPKPGRVKLIGPIRRLLIRRLAPLFGLTPFKFGLVVRKVSTIELGVMLYG